MGNDISRANDENSYYTRAVDNAIRSATPSIFGDSPVRSFGSLIDSAIRSSTASSTDSLGLSGLENFEITPAPFQQAQAQHDRVAPPPPPPPNTVNLQQPLLQTEERLNGVTPPLLPLNTGFTSRREGVILQSPILKSFSYNVLRAATRNFRSDTVLGEDAFGLVFKGWIDENSLAATKPGRGMTVAVKRHDGDGFPGHEEWLTEINYLGQLQHPNLVRLIGYCLEDDHRLLVYEFMPKGSMDNHLFRRGSYLFSWYLRMKIVLGAAKGLAFIHSTEPKVIHRDFKTSNILLDTNYNAKLSNFGLARDGPTGDQSHVSTRVMGTGGGAYTAPEYIATGHLTTKSDVYSFGVVLLEMISGRRAFDMCRPTGEKNLVYWALPYLRNKRWLYLLNKRRVLRVMDPCLEGQYSVRQAQAAAALARQCLALEPKRRPNMDEVVKALQQLQE